MAPEATTLPATRIPLFVEIGYKKSYARQLSAGVLRNISLTGAFLQSTDGLEPNEKLILEFAISGRKRKIQASVVWTNETGAGLKFHPFNNRDVQIVDDLMYFVKNTRDSKKSILDTIFKQVA